MAARRVLIVDDHAAFLEAASALLVAEGFEIVGSVTSGDEALAAVLRLPTDLVLLDLYLPGNDGVAVAERIAALDSPPAVILISSHDEAGAEARVMAAPVRGFLAKRDLAWEAIDRLLA